jgi:signal transduction histidine kinase
MAEQSPDDHGRRGRTGQALAAALATGLVTAAAWSWVVLTLHSDRLWVIVAAAVTSVALCVTVFRTMERTRKVRSLEREIAGLREEARESGAALDAGRAELERLVDQSLPSVVDLLRGGASADTVLTKIPRPREEAHRRIVSVLVTEISTEGRRRAAATAACANAAARVQALTTTILADLRELENTCAEEMLGDLLKIDHSTAQAGRLADSIAVLTGGRSGRRWTKPIKMESILRGAMGRIGAYQRVRVHSASTAAIVGYAAEDLMHALAELMDNATKFSAPTEDVHVYVEELNNGAVITIEDGGLGMKSHALARAESAVSTDQQLDLTTLSGTRLGLAVVGCLARKHQLHVFFRPSSRGGVGVVIRLPRELLTQARPETLPAPAGRPPSREAMTVPVPAAQNHRAEHPTGELPKRPPGRTLTAASRPAPAPEAPAPRPRPASGSRFGAFQQRLSSTAPDDDGGRKPDQAL